jgi:hypothetical protein
LVMQLSLGQFASRVAGRLTSRVACAACGADGPEDLQLMHTPSGKWLCHPCLLTALRATERDQVAGDRAGRCVACGKRRKALQLNAIGRTRVCDDCLRHARAALVELGSSPPPAEETDNVGFARGA